MGFAAQRLIFPDTKSNKREKFKTARAAETVHRRLPVLVDGLSLDPAPKHSTGQRRTSCSLATSTSLETMYNGGEADVFDCTYDYEQQERLVCCCWVMFTPALPPTVSLQGVWKRSRSHDATKLQFSRSITMNVYFEKMQLRRPKHPPYINVEKENYDFDGEWQIYISQLREKKLKFRPGVGKLLIRRLHCTADR